MPSRREFLQIGVTAATTWPLASTAADAAGAPRAGLGLLPIYKIVFDRRYGHSVRFAERAAALGLATAAIEGDMTRVWYDDIHHEWRRRPIAIAGLTAHGPLFCFEQLGRDTGLRVVFRAEHRHAQHNELWHTLSGPEPMLDVCAALDRAGSRWPATMADAVASCPTGRWRTRAGRAATPNAEWPADARDVNLYTWIIAPALRARPQAAS